MKRAINLVPIAIVILLPSLGLGEQGEPKKPNADLVRTLKVNGTADERR